MQPSMSSVIMMASPPPPLLLERGVDSEVPYLLIIYLMRLSFTLFVLLLHIRLSKHHISLPSPIGEGAGVRLELQRNIPHDIKACHWDKTNLRVTVLVRMTVVVEDSAIYPSAGSIMAIEDVVKIHAEDSFLQTDKTLCRTERVADVDIRLRIARQRTGYVLGVVEILTTYEVCMPYSLNAFVMQI